MTPWQSILFKRHVAYRQCFMGDDGQLTPAAKIVLADIAKFAGVGVPTVVSPISQTVDVPATMQRIGRADVFHRVWRYLRLPIHQLFEVQEMRDE
jgi:hypothetical protein